MSKLPVVLSCSMICACAGSGSASEPDGGTGFVLPGNMGSYAGDLLTAFDGGGGVVDGGSIVLMVTVRDFKMYNRNDQATNPDFENVVSDDRGIPEEWI